MSESKIIHELDIEATRLEMVSQTMQALEIAISEGSSQIGNDALAIPCEVLIEISNKITSLVEALFSKEAKAV